MPFDSEPSTAFADLALCTDEVVGAFGLQPTPNNLLDMAAEMERRLHIFPGGPRLARRIVSELRRRALALRSQEDALPAERGAAPEGAAAPASLSSGPWDRRR